MKIKTLTGNATMATRPFMIAILVLSLTGVTGWGARAAAGDNAPSAIGASGLPVPRFVSLKSDRVNIRVGPGTEYRIDWVFRRAGLPLEVIREYQGWRQIRDAGGSVGWVLGAMLSGRRTALVLPWEIKKGAKQRAEPVTVELRAGGNTNSQAIAVVEAGVLAAIKRCTGVWCRISVAGTRGYVEQKKLWGVYTNERVE